MGEREGRPWNKGIHLTRGSLVFYQLHKWEKHFVGSQSSCNYLKYTVPYSRNYLYYTNTHKYFWHELDNNVLTGGCGIWRGLAKADHEEVFGMSSVALMFQHSLHLNKWLFTRRQRSNCFLNLLKMCWILGNKS